MTIKSMSLPMIKKANFLRQAPACPKGKNVTHQAQSLLGHFNIGVGTEEVRAALGPGPGNYNAGKFLSGNLDKRIAFIIAQSNVILRFFFL